MADADIVKVLKRNEDYIARVSLLAVDRKFTEAAHKAFCEAFANFSKAGKMNREDCASFVRVCCGTYAYIIGVVDSTVDITDSRVKDVFAQYDKDNRGYIEETQFIDFYESAAWRNEETVWSNLRGLGYGPDLKRIEVSKKVITSCPVTCKRLPRHILSNNPGCLRVLFDLLGILTFPTSVS